VSTLSFDTLRKYSYFSGLSDCALKEISGKLIPVQVRAGTQIIKEGSSADAFYLIERGEVDVIKSTKCGQAAKITSLKCGEGFGETALLTCSPRNTSVTARTNVTVLKLLKKDFEEIVRMDSVFSNILCQKVIDQSRYNKLKTLQPFALLEPEKMFTLIEKLKEKKYAAGENIIIQGEAADAYYIIRSGLAAVIRKEKDREPERVAVLSEGDGFGEEALIRGRQRNATVKTIDETIVLTLSKNDFEQILKKSFLEWEFPEDIPAEKRQKSIFVDTRTSYEYEEEHIEDAVNIPLGILRQNYSSLDPGKEYYTYCTSDERSMTAAFLMGSMGFKVKSIKGGLGAWDGPVTQKGDGIHTIADQDGYTVRHKSRS